MTLQAGYRLGPYEVVSRLGAGGMGEVYRARDRRLDREVAVKVLPAVAVADETARLRLLREARMAARLKHIGRTSCLILPPSSGPCPSVRGSVSFR